MLGRIGTSRDIQASVLGPIVRKAIKITDKFSKHSADYLVRSEATERPNYAYCMLVAARLAKSLGMDRISAIEIGVAGGNGLAFMVEFAERVKADTGVTIECIGFDTGEGMPPPESEKDLPYWFQASQYRMDVDALKKRLPEARLVLGNVKETIPAFFEDFDAAPIGAIFNDTDYFSSTRDSLSMFDHAVSHPERFLPRIPMYFDDILGSTIEMYGPFNGQLAAITEYNERSENVKVHLNQNLLSLNHVKYRYQIYYAHLFAHPRYNEYIGNDEQLVLEDKLKLR
ncbi:hypothetical protein CD351_00545 [Erythrobacter sp. KY5]|uniref:hypothetical protein n=1 Tax=Erythrobacter sp. KY5 TaxID=2011159 RepID=UPI000DBF1C4C|nr:hypothetical protein [Erythrobacter sp. KY5]AWW72910.1 hypothetical protein CD351_00545 [Erythrobacter sp. KY5]